MVQITLTSTTGSTHSLTLSTVERVRALSDGFIIYDTLGGKVLTAPYAAFAALGTTQAVAETLQRATGAPLYAVPMRRYNLDTGRVDTAGTDFIAPVAVDYIETMLPAPARTDDASAYVGLRISLRAGEWVDTLLAPHEAQDLIAACTAATPLCRFAPYHASSDGHLHMDRFSVAATLYVNPAHVSGIVTTAAAGCALVFHGNSSNTLELVVRQGSPRQFTAALMQATQGLAVLEGATPPTALRLSDYTASHEIAGEHNGKFLLRLERPLTPANPYARYLQLAFDSAAQRKAVHDRIKPAHPPGPPARGL